FGLPPGGLTVTAGTVAISLAVGVVVTVFASVFPAIKASRIPPLAALREVSLDRSGTSAGRITLGLIFLAFGLLTLATLLIPSDYLILWRTGVGATLTFLGYLIFSPVAARPVGIALGAPIKKLRGVAGGMAQRNAIRNPRRTANTAAALMVGVAVVTLFTIFAASIKTSIDASVAGSFRGELVMSSSNFNGAGFSPKMVEEISEVEGIAALAPLGRGTVLANGKQVNLTVADPAELGQLVVLPSTGEPVESLNPRQLAISQETASENGFGVGNEVAVSFADGITELMTIGSIYEGEELVGNAIISPVIYGEHVRQITFTTILMSLVPGADEQAVQQAVQVIADSFSAGQVQTRAEFIQSTADQIDQLLNIVYVLLILAIVIALMGITNTLSLSIYECTRELGLLRAVGQTRGQTRSMVRWESVIIALFGTLSGMLLGVVLGWALMRAVQAQEDVARFTMPTDQLVFVAIAGALVGVLAGLRPAARAAKLNILAAISSE
ncbi:MAG: FtsX-like permease family protein, partial [Actinobacteria bacterium]|nr:FtsX-like permease family protein [Actinomycetota bacterium]